VLYIAAEVALHIVNIKLQMCRSFADGLRPLPGVVLGMYLIRYLVQKISCDVMEAVPYFLLKYAKQMGGNYYRPSSCSVFATRNEFTACKLRSEQTKSLLFILLAHF
jgi:hypothetical protein